LSVGEIPDPLMPFGPFMSTRIDCGGTGHSRVVITRICRDKLSFNLASHIVASLPSGSSGS
jgi:hypothetical protein